MTRFEALLGMATGTLMTGLVAVGPVAAQDGTSKAVYQQVLKATTRVIAQQEGNRFSQGTGWVVSRFGRQVVTNAHVVGTADRVVVMFPVHNDGRLVAEREYYDKNYRKLAKDGLAVEGKVLKRDTQRDLAVIVLDSIPGDATELRLAASSPSPRDRVHSIGNPGASEALWIYTSGTVRQVYRKQDSNMQVIETQSPLNPGDSGGPVVNDRGELVGVNRAIKSGAQLISLCIDVSELKAFLRGGGSSTPSSGGNDIQLALNLRDHGTALMREGNYKSAVDVFTNALRLDPRDFSTYNERGAAYTFLDRDADAIRDFTESIKLNGRYPVAYRNRGAAQARLGKHAEAVQDFTRAIELNPRYVRAYRDRAAAYRRLGKTALAEADEKMAATLDGSPR